MPIFIGTVTESESSALSFKAHCCQNRILHTLTAKILPHLFVNPVHASDFMRANLLVAFPAHRVDLNVVILHDQS
jgi:hypothetical protein